MTAGSSLRALAPARWLLLVIALAVALIGLGRGLGFSWDPFGLAARRLEAAERRSEAAAADVAARRLEVEGAAVLARRLERQHQQSVELARATAVIDTEARNADDAHIPLDPDRVARLRAHDRELCRLAPALCPAAAAGSAGFGPDLMPAGPVAGGADGG